MLGELHFGTVDAMWTNETLDLPRAFALLILSGDYLGHLPTHFARQWEMQGRMRRLHADNVSYDDRFHLISRRRETNRAAMILFDSVSKCCRRS